MNDSKLSLTIGHRQGHATGRLHGHIVRAVMRAIRAGYRIGQHVRIGQVAGQVVGYNIGAFGEFAGARYPLLVCTDLGVVKCSESELVPA